MDNEFHLDNPPIKEVALAIYIQNPRYNNEFIQNFKNSNLLDFPKNLPIKNINIAIDDNEGITVSTKGICSLSNETDSEIWSFDLNRILYSDKTKYSNFDNYLKKFLNKFNILCTNLGENVYSNHIALRYSNEFSLKMEELDKNFTILPLFQQHYNNKLYALNTSYMCFANIVNAENEKMKASVNANFVVDKDDTAKFLINFDIEIKYDVDNIICQDTEKLKECLSEMRLFKNKIFFSNIINPRKVFDNV